MQERSTPLQESDAWWNAVSFVRKACSVFGDQVLNPKPWSMIVVWPPRHKTEDFLYRPGLRREITGPVCKRHRFHFRFQVPKISPHNLAADNMRTLPKMSNFAISDDLFFPSRMRSKAVK